MPEDQVWFLEGHTTAEICRRLVKTLRKKALTESTLSWMMQTLWDWRERWSPAKRWLNQGTRKVRKLATIEKTLHKSKVYGLGTLSAKTGILHATFYRCMIQILKIQELSRKWVPHKLTLNQLKMRVMCSPCNLRSLSKRKACLEARRFNLYGQLRTSKVRQ